MIEYKQPTNNKQYYGSNVMNKYCVIFFLFSHVTRLLLALLFNVSVSVCFPFSVCSVALAYFVTTICRGPARGSVARCTA